MADGTSTWFCTIVRYDQLVMTFIVMRWRLDNIYLGRFTPQREDVPYVALQEVFDMYIILCTYGFQIISRFR